LGGSKADKLEAYSLVTEHFHLTVEKQKLLPIREWFDYYKVAVKKHKQKLELMQLNQT